MVDMSRSLRHLAWADGMLFTGLSTLPPTALEARFSAGAWSVGRLAQHIVEGAEWYRYCLTSEPWTELPLPTGPRDLLALRDHLALLDATLLAEGQGDDGPVEFDDENGTTTAMRSTLLAQACLHATEHRAQIACALEVSGFEPLVLDDYDLWAFEEHERAPSP